MKQQLVQIISISNKHRYFSMLDNLCWLSKNLYNVALFHIRQHYKENKSYLNYFELNKILSKSKNIDYISLPYIQCSQQILRQVDKQYVSFYKMIKSNKMKGKHIRLPKYKDKEKGRNIVIYTNQCFKQKKDKIILKIDKSNKIEFKTDKTNIQQVRIVPKGNHINVEIIYNTEYEIKPNNNRYASIDLGLNNICTLTSNVCQSIIYNGKTIKSINAFYNKKKAKLQSQLKNKYTSNRIKRLSNRRNNKIKDYLHKLSYTIVKYMEDNQLNTLFVGKNIGWKENINIGKVNNQNFISIPYNMLISMLDYKCKLAGINMIIVNEAYTSKCSFIDNEKICKHETYLGNRKLRGLYISNSGIKINADINGSFNIMRLGLEKINVKLDAFQIMPENKRFVYNPIRIEIFEIKKFE